MVSLTCTEYVATTTRCQGGLREARNAQRRVNPLSTRRSTQLYGAVLYNSTRDQSAEPDNAGICMGNLR